MKFATRFHFLMTPYAMNYSRNEVKAKFKNTSKGSVYLTYIHIQFFEL